jgi:hypothetical protein
MSKTTLTGNVNKNIVWAQKEVDQELAAVAEVVVSGFPRFSNCNRFVWDKLGRLNVTSLSFGSAVHQQV